VLQTGLFILGILQLTPSLTANVASLNKLFLLGTIFYILTVWTAKISVNLLHLGLTRHMKAHKVAIASLFFIGLSGVVLILLELFSCWPISRRFQANGISGCDEYRNDVVFYVLTALNISTDLLCKSLPSIARRCLQDSMCPTVSCSQKDHGTSTSAGHLCSFWTRSERDHSDGDTKHLDIAIGEQLSSTHHHNCQHRMQHANNPECGSWFKFSLYPKLRPDDTVWTVWTGKNG
jgi:hypothetical protein